MCRRTALSRWRPGGDPGSSRGACEAFGGELGQPVSQLGGDIVCAQRHADTVFARFLRGWDIGANGSLCEHECDNGRRLRQSAAQPRRVDPPSTRADGGPVWTLCPEGGCFPRLAHALPVIHTAGEPHVRHGTVPFARRPRPQPRPCARRDRGRPTRTRQPSLPPGGQPRSTTRSGRRARIRPSVV
jgi:hypothetical protein